MAEKKTIELEVKSNLGESISDLKALKRQLKDTAAGSEEFKKIFNQIDDLEDKIKSAKNTSSDWIDSLESAGGPIGALGASLNRAKVATQSFGGALKATGIGLVVALIGGLVAAFQDNEVAMKKLQPLLDGIGKLFQGVFRAVEPLFNTLVDLAISALPTVSKAFGVVYSSVTAVFQSLGLLGGAIKKLISGDFSGAWKDAKSSVNDFSKNYDASIKRFNEGSKEMSKTEKEEAEKRAEARKASQEKQAANDEKAKQERIRKAEEEKKRLEEIEKERQALIGRQGERARDEYEAAEKLIADARKANEDALKTENQIKVEKENADFEAKKLNLLNKGLSIEEIEKEHKRNLAIINKTENDKILADAKEQADKEIALNLAVKEAKRNALNTGLDILLQFAGKNKAVALGILAVQKGLAIADIVIGASRALAISSANLATIPAILPPGIPNPAFAIAAGSTFKSNLVTKLTAATSIASILAAGISGAKSITAGGGGGGSASGGGGGGGGGTAAAPAAPSFNVVGASSTNQLAQTIGNQQQQPIKAYVVANDVTTQQSLDRNIIQSASIG
jgi:flagellar biosynthesis GTPase FlhF